MRKPLRFVSVEPSVLVVGAVQDSVTEPFALAVTLIVNAGSETDALPSLTLMTTFEYVPTCAAVGVPVSRPFDVLKVAQAGLFWMLNVSVSLFASLAVGVNVYATPARTDVSGVPLITGGVVGGGGAVVDGLRVIAEGAGG